MLISIIIPCFNNEGSISKMAERLINVFQDNIFQEHEFEVVWVDDGSKDETYNNILSVVKNSNIFFKQKVIKLTRNFGSYNSFLAGMNYAEGDCNVYLHADLQDPPELIPQMFKAFLRENKLIIANRHDREDSSFFSSFYHWFVGKYAIKKIPKGGFDLIMFDKQIREDVLNISEKNTNIVYLISWLGYPYVNIPYQRKKREDGTSQWTIIKKVRLFIDTVFSFTDIPILLSRLIFVLASSCFSFFFFLYLLKISIIENQNLFFMISGLIFIISIQLLILGEYLVRVHESVRKRPNFVVSKIEEN